MERNAVRVDEELAFYRSLSASQQQRFLAILAHELTILARGAYSVGGEGIDNPPLIRAINEMQHHLLATLSKHLEGSTERWPEDVLFRALADSARVKGFEQEWEFALSTAANRIRAAR
jgi:hypothetical protein